MTNFVLLFMCAVAVNIAVTIRSTGIWKKLQNRAADDCSSNSAADSPEMVKRHQSLLKKYLIVYLLATMSDWLQGPYVYALYSDYGYSQHEIAILFVAGFGSSMVFGSFIGGMADWGGRRTFVILYAILYAASCLTKHFPSFGILMIGRLLGGIATSLLFSVFEAWVIRAHADDGVQQFLSKTFTWAAYGNSTVAIIAGLIANKAASLNKMEPLFGEGGSIYFGGFLNPFDISLISLCFCGVLAYTLWDENYGDDASTENNTTTSLMDNNTETNNNKGNPKWYLGCQQAFTVTFKNKQILLCGIISSLFEGSMYIFVFMWTPALLGGGSAHGDDDNQVLPFGLIFSTFMVSCMIGSSFFSILMEIGNKPNKMALPVEAIAVGIFGMSSISMMLISLSSSRTIKFIAMNLFEICVGMYFPTMGTMKGVIVPENQRAAIYNLFRVPLNFIVLFSLLTSLSDNESFFLNMIMMLIATFLQIKLVALRKQTSSSSTAAFAGTTNMDDSEERVPLQDDREMV